jgi:hypothetical protein
MSSIRSIARAIKRQALLEKTGMSSIARKHHKARAIAAIRAMEVAKRKKATEEVLQRMSQKDYEALPRHVPES